MWKVNSEEEVKKQKKHEIAKFCSAVLRPQLHPDHLPDWHRRRTFEGARTKCAVVRAARAADRLPGDYPVGAIGELREEIVLLIKST